MNTFAPSCKILTARLCRSGLAAGVLILKRENPVGACAEPLRATPRQAANRMKTVIALIFSGVFLLGSGCAVIDGIRQTDPNYHSAAYQYPPDAPGWRTNTNLLLILLVLVVSSFGCSTNGRYADGLDHWPVQVHSVDSGSN